MRQFDPVRELEYFKTTTFMETKTFGNFSWGLPVVHPEPVVWGWTRSVSIQVPGNRNVRSYSPDSYVVKQSTGKLVVVSKSKTKEGW